MTAQPRTSPGIWAGPQTPSTPVTSLLTESSTVDVGEQRSVRGRRRRSSTQRSLGMGPRGGRGPDDCVQGTRARAALPPQGVGRSAIQSKVAIRTRRQLRWLTTRARIPIRLTTTATVVDSGSQVRLQRSSPDRAVRRETGRSPGQGPHTLPGPMSAGATSAVTRSLSPPPAGTPFDPGTRTRDGPLPKQAGGTDVAAPSRASRATVVRVPGMAEAVGAGWTRFGPAAAQ